MREVEGDNATIFDSTIGPVMLDGVKCDQLPGGDGSQGRSRVRSVLFCPFGRAMLSALQINASGFKSTSG